MALDDRRISDRSDDLLKRHAALHAEMLEEYEQYLAATNHGAFYTFLGWEHLAACAASYYLTEVAGVRSPWLCGLLWIAQSLVVLAAVSVTKAGAPPEVLPIPKLVNRIWGIFLLLCWSVASLNVLAGHPVFVFLPVLATLSSFAFLVLASVLSRRFIAAALTMWITGCLIAHFPTYGFLLYGAGWLLVLQVVGIMFWRRRQRWLQETSRQTPTRTPRTAGPARVTARQTL